VLADPPKGAAEWKAVEGGFSCALDLTKHIIEKYGKDEFCIATAGYPEGHPNVIKKIEEGRELSEAEKGRVVTLEDGNYVCSDADYAAEMAYLKEKVDAGASLIITQMFFDVAVFKSFMDDCVAAGITVPIVPGLMLVQAAGGFTRMTAFCKTRVPAAIKARVEEVKHDEAAVKAYGAELGAQMCEELVAMGAPGLHFYTLNLEKVTFGVLERLGMLQDTSDVAAAPATAAAAAASGVTA
jgi:methylenetetrahydrofolate reductase (NADPH)